MEIQAQQLAPDPLMAGIVLSGPHPAALNHLCTIPAGQKAALKPAYSAKGRFPPIEGFICGGRASVAVPMPHTADDQSMRHGCG